MYITYHNENNEYTTEKVDEYGITFYNNKAFFNNKMLDVEYIDSINETPTD